MKLFNLFFISLLVLIFFGCSSSTETTKTDETDQISDSSPKIITSDNINIIIPPGWKEIEDNNEQVFEIWLINKFENAVIAFIPINLSHNLESSSEQSEFDIIEQILITKKKTSGRRF